MICPATAQGQAATPVDQSVCQVTTALKLTSPKTLIMKSCIHHSTILTQSFLCLLALAASLPSYLHSAPTFFLFLPLFKAPDGQAEDLQAEHIGVEIEGILRSSLVIV